MKTWILTLTPWMVGVAIAQSDGPRPAEVVFTHYGRSAAPAWQLGAECFVSTQACTEWGWQVRENSMDLSLTVDGRTIKVPFRTQAGHKIFPLGQAARLLGAEGSWKPGTGTFEVVGVVRAVRVEREMIVVESSLPTKPRVSTMSDPDRLIFDFDGQKLIDKTSLLLPDEARVGQFQPGVVRVVVETEKRPAIPARSLIASKRFSLNYGIETQRPEGEEIVTAAPPAQQSTFLPPGEDVGSPKPLTAPKTVVPTADLLAFPNLLETSAAKAVLEFRLSSTMMSSAQVKRLDPRTIEVTLPGVRYAGPTTADVESETIESISVIQGPAQTVATIQLMKPMGVELSMKGLNATLVLIRPKVGDGLLSSKTVVVDAGHGGHDGGASGGGAKEKQMTLAISKKVSDALTAQGATVIMTRKTDVFIPLQERSMIANRTAADFFISIHINSSSSGSFTGGMTFYHKKDPIGQLLADCIQREIGKVSKLKSHGAWSDQRLYDSGLAVLRHSQMPAVLIEMGFINQAGDRNRMLSADFQNAVAEAIVKGIKVYLGNE